MIQLQKPEGLSPEASANWDFVVSAVAKEQAADEAFAKTLPDVDCDRDVMFPSGRLASGRKHVDTILSDSLGKEFLVCLRCNRVLQET